MFGTDERGQSIVIGAILVFAILVTAFASYQAVVVPNQNKQAEFEHSQSVQSQVVSLRDGVLNSAFDGSQPSLDLSLGTRYPLRLFAVNPAPVSGTVQTTSARSLSVSGASDVCPGPEETRQIRYSPEYNYLQNPPTFAIENTVAYRQYSSAFVTDSGQRLVTGERINLVPLRNEFRDNGVETSAIELTPGKIKTTTVTNPTVSVPTRLSEEKWEQLLDGEVAASNIVVNDGGTPNDRSDDTLQLDLSGDYNVICSPVGVDGDPPGGVRESVTDPSGGSLINPAGPGSIVLRQVSIDGNAKSVDLTFENTGDEPRQFSQARLTFFYEDNRNGEVDSLTLNGNSNDVFELRDPLEPVDETVKIQPGQTETITLSNSGMQKNDFFGLEVEFDDGSKARYFVDVSDSGGGGGAPSASQTSLAGSSSFSNDGAANVKEGISFSIENTGSDSVTVTQISIDSTTSGASIVTDASPEFERTDTGVLLFNGDLNIDGTQYDSSDTSIAAGATADFELEDFEDGSGNDIDLKQEDVTITLYYSDGSSKQYTLSG